MDGGLIVDLGVVIYSLSQASTDSTISSMNISYVGLGQSISLSGT